MGLISPWAFTNFNGIECLIRAVTMIDVATRWIEILPYSNNKSNIVLFIFNREWICCYPRPRIIIFDNGTNFSSEFHELLLSFGTTPRQTIKNPQANSFIERIRQVI